MSDTALSTPLPTALAGPASDTRGTENIGISEMQVPRLAIAQKGSPQIEDGNTKFIDGLKLFGLFNTVTEETYGQGPVEVAIVSFRQYAMLFDDQNKVVEQDVSLNDPRLKFGRDANGRPTRPEATLFFEYFAVKTDTLEPLVLTFKGAGLKAAKQINSLLRLGGGPAWKTTFLITSEKQTSGIFTFGAYKVKRGGPASDEVKAAAESLYSAASAGLLKVEEPTSEKAYDDTVPF